MWTWEHVKNYFIRKKKRMHMFFVVLLRFCCCCKKNENLSYTHTWISSSAFFARLFVIALQLVRFAPNRFVYFICTGKEKKCEFPRVATPHSRSINQVEKVGPGIPCVYVCVYYLLLFISVVVGAFLHNRFVFVYCFCTGKKSLNSGGNSSSLYKRSEK